MRRESRDVDGRACTQNPDGIQVFLKGSVPHTKATAFQPEYNFEARAYLA